MTRGPASDLLVGMINKSERIEELTACGVSCKLWSARGRKTVWRSRETRSRVDEFGIASTGAVVRVERFLSARPGGHERWVITRSVSFRGSDALIALQHGGAITSVRHAHFQFIGEGRSFEDAEYECVQAEVWLEDAGSDGDG